MTTDPITFVHITDLHINTAEAEDEMLLSDTTAALRRTLDDIAKMNPQPRFIVASGDLTNQGNAAAYALLREMMAQATVPVIYTLGNHDTREGFVAEFGDLHSDPALPYNTDMVVAGIHVIALDSSVPDEIGGSWEPGQIDWLMERLADHADLPKLLVMHHAPMLDLANKKMEWESLSAVATEELRTAIEGHNVVGLLAGHIHLDRATHWHGVPVFVGQGLHAGSDPLDLVTGLGMLDATGFGIATLRPSGLTMTYAAHPQSRALLHRLDFEMIRKHMEQVAAEKAAAEAAAE
jgi:Icc protein